MSKNNLQYFLLGLILLLHAFLLTKLIFFPYPELFIYPYLTNHGLKPYQQILDQHFPGLMFLPINLNNLGMTTPEVARVWLISIVVLTQILLFLISRQIFKSGTKALFVNLLYLVWQPFFEGWVLWIDNFLPLFLLPAFYFLLKGGKSFFWSGVFLGLGIVFKQVLIPLSGLVLIYLIWEIREMRKIGKFLLGLSLPAALMVIYLFSIGVLKDFWYWTVSFNLTIFAQYGGKEVPTLAHLSRVLVVFGVALLALFSQEKKIVYTLLIFLMGSLAGVFARFDFVHFQPALPFAVLGTVYSLSWLGRKGKFRILGVGYMLIAIWWLAIFYKGHISNKIFFFDDQTKLIASKIRQYSKPDDKIFVFGSVPHLYQMSDTLPAGNIFVFQFPWFLMVAENRLLEGLKKDQPQLIVADRTVEIEGHKISDFAKKLDVYIQSNYQTFDVVGNTQIMRKVPR